MAIVTDLEKAQQSPCTCYRLEDGELMCWSDGAVGTLSDEQEKTPDAGGVCPSKRIGPATSEIRERIHSFTDAIYEAEREYRDGDTMEWWNLVEQKLEQQS